ncbi:MAG TPA: acyltransferase [Actinocrinis sp.]|nr:acyltransferase [Actinocrinis sp.]
MTSTTDRAAPAAAGRQQDQNLSRLPSLTGLRIVAAAMIFFFHAQFEHIFSNSTSQNVYVHVLGEGGPSGVGFFYVLSGFLLAWSARPTDTTRKFWRRRFFKIYPNHLVTYVVAFVLLVATAQPTGILGPILNLFLLQPWSPRLLDVISVNSVAWSLGCEAFFYLLFPFWLRLVRKIRPQRLWFVAIALLVAMWIVPAVVEALPLPTGGPRVPFGNITGWQFLLAYTAPPVRTLDFVLGIVMARIVMEGKWINLPLRWASLLFVAGYLGANLVPVMFRLVAVTALPIALLIPAAAVADVRATKSVFRTRTMVWLGDVSFAFYLWHRLVLKYGHMALGSKHAWSTAEALGLLVCAFGLTLLLSALLHRFVENPMMKRFSKARAKRTELTPAPVPA